MSANQPIVIPRNLLFRYRLRAPRIARDCTGFQDLPESSELPVLGTLDGQKPYSQIKAGWNADGMLVGVAVRGKQQSLWTRVNQPLESDGVQVWIDTRDTHNIHRASRYCHWFYALPGGGQGKSVGHAGMLKINRAKEDAPTINRGQPQLKVQLQAGGYDLLLRIPANLLNGWDPDEHRTMGFHLVVSDRELGWNTLGVGADLPIQEDPSLWNSLQLVDDTVEP